LHLTLIVLLIFSILALALPSQVCICLLQLLLLILQSSLNDFSTSKQPFFKVAECLILNHNGRLLIKFLGTKSEFLENWCEIVFLLCPGCLFFISLFTLLHLVAGLIINSLFKNLREQGLSVRILAQLLNILFKLEFPKDLGLRTLLLLLNLLVTASLHLENSLVSLCLLRLLGVLVVHVTADLSITSDQFISDVGLTTSGDSSTIIMFVYVNTALGKVELCATNLFFGFLVRVQSELLSHF
jgi:hypothetical protein